MSILPLTFYNYIFRISSSDITDRFKHHFGDRLEQLPDKVVSSKYIINNLSISDQKDLCLFKDAFMEYFRYKCQRYMET